MLATAGAGRFGAKRPTYTVFGPDASIASESADIPGEPVISTIPVPTPDHVVPWSVDLRTPPAPPTDATNRVPLPAGSTAIGAATPGSPGPTRVHPCGRQL